MRKVIKSLIRIVVQNEISWSVIRPFIELAHYAQDRRDAFVTRQSVTDQRIMTALGQPMVKNGPFKGMIYPRFLYPSNFSKIIGSYEKEISDIIETLCNKRFTEIVNIGCAEGYYAVGFARRIDNVRVTAYDNRRRAREHCRELARVNRVDKKIRILGSFAPESLTNMNFNGRALIVCDCEGAEKEIFTPENSFRVQNCELLIETHDCMDITISDYIRNLFSKTHDILSRQSTDDNFKARNYHFRETDDLDLQLKKLIFQERRPAPMEWFYLTPKLPRK